MFQVQQSEATAERRRIPIHLVDGTDGISPELSEAGGQPQISKNGAAFGNTTATLTAIGNGAYYVELTATEVDTIGFGIVRYDSAATAEFQIMFQVVPWDPYDATALGLTNLDAAVSTRSSHSAQDAATEVWSEALPGAFGADSAGERLASTDDTVGTNLDATVSSRAVPGDAMDLVTDAVDAAAVATTGANEIRDAILADSTPFNGADVVTILEEAISANKGIWGRDAFSPGTGDTFYWDPANGNDANDGRTPAQARQTFTSVHSLTQAYAGDTIILLPDPVGGATVVITDQIDISNAWVTLQCPGAAARFTPTATTGATVTLSGSGVRLRGAWVQTAATGSGVGILCNVQGSSFIEDCIVDSTQGDGIHVDRTATIAGATIRRTKVESAGAVGIHLAADSASGRDIRKCLIEDCRIEDSVSHGIHFDSPTSSEEVHNNTVLNTRVINAGGWSFLEDGSNVHDNLLLEFDSIDSTSGDVSLTGSDSADFSRAHQKSLVAKTFVTQSGSTTTEVRSNITPAGTTNDHYKYATVVVHDVSTGQTQSRRAIQYFSLNDRFLLDRALDFTPEVGVDRVYIMSEYFGRLAHLLEDGTNVPNPTVGTWIDQMLNASGAQTFDQTTDSQEALRNQIDTRSAPGDAMDLITDAVDADAVATTGANEIRDAILADSTPFNGADIAAILADTANIDSNVDVVLSTRASQASLDSLAEAVYTRTFTVSAGSSTSEVRSGSSTTIGNDFYKGAVVVVHDVSEGEAQARVVSQYFQTNDRFLLGEALDFTPEIGVDRVYVVNLSASHLRLLEMVDVDADANPTVGSWVDLTLNADGAQNYSQTTDSQEAIRNKLDADLDVAVSTRSSHTAQDAATEVWSEPLPGGFAADSAGERLSTADDRVDVTLSTRSSHAAGDVWDEDIVAAHGGADTSGLLLSQLTRRTVTFNTAVADGSVVGQLADDGTATFDRTTDSLQAIADSGGGGPTAAQIADAVWDEDIVAAHGGADTSGLLLSELTRRTVTFNTVVADGSVFGQIADDGTATFDRTTDSLQAIADGGGGPTAAQIADAVWDEDATDHQTQGTFGQAIGDPGADTDTIWALANANLDAAVSSRAAPGAAMALVTNAVNTTSLANATITAAKFGTAAITSTVLADNSIVTSKIGSSAINDTKIADNTITANKIAINALANSKFANGAISASKFAANAIDAAALATDAANEIATSVWTTTLPGAFPANSAGERLSTTDDRVDVTLSTRSSHSAADVDTTLTGSHGAGSWQTATGFATPGDAMALTSAERNAVRDAIWNATLSSYPTAGTAGRTLSDAEADTSTLVDTRIPDVLSLVNIRSEAATAVNDNARLILLEKILRNRMETNPSTGVWTLYDDDSVTPLLTANIYENVGGTIPYDGDSAINRRNRLI